MVEAIVEQAPVFISGQDDYHTYRIPALVVTQEGTILAFCEARRNSARDDGDIDLALKRSSDNGKTWGAMQIIWDDGENTIGNPAPVVDRETGTIWLPFCWNNDRVFITSSTDDGATWSTPEEITQDVKWPAKEGEWYATGPGHAIQLENGRLFIPSYGRGRSHTVYSDDHGATWKLGGILGDRSGECEAVQTMDGRLYLNARRGREDNRRAYAWSEDGGDTWSEVKLDDTLVEPPCQASVVRYTHEKHHDKNRVLFSNPASENREMMTVRISYDECQTWNAGKVLNEGPSAYSDLCILPDMSISCLYERGKERPYDTITFTKFNLEWLTDGADHLKK